MINFVNGHNLTMGRSGFAGTEHKHKIVNISISVNFMKKVFKNEIEEYNLEHPLLFSTSIS